MLRLGAANFHWRLKSWQAGAVAFSSSRTIRRRPSSSWISSRRAAMHVDLAADGDEGLRRRSRADYAVMTIDRMLPGIDGLAVIRRLREDGIAHAGPDRQRARRGRRSRARPARRRRRLSRQAVRVRRIAGARRGARAPQRHRGQGDRLARRRSRARPGVTHGQSRRPGRSSCCRANSRCSNIWSATRARSCRGRCCCSMSGICISIPRPTSSTSMSGASAARSTSEQAYPLIHTIRGVGFCVRAPR